MKSLNRSVTATPLSAIKEILSLAGRTEGVVSLAWGLPLYDMEPSMRDHLSVILTQKPELNKYAAFTGIPPLRSRLSETLSHAHARPVQEDQLLVTAGAMEALFITAQTLLEPGDEVIIPEPCFVGQLEQLAIMGARAVMVPLEEASGWYLDTEKVEASITSKTKAILITTPNNPTGTVYDRATLQRLLEIARRRDLYLISDETYHFLTYDCEAVSLLDLEPDPRSIVIRSFSKQYALTGMRVGYLLADASILKTMMKAHDAVIAAVPTLSQHAALFALESFPAAASSQYHEDFIRKRRLALSLIRQYGDVLSVAEPQGAFYLMPRYTRDMPSADLARQLVTEAKVAVVPGSAFGPSGEHHFRISFAGSESSIEEGIHRMGKYLQ